jgi:membrane-associated protein
MVSFFVDFLLHFDEKLIEFICEYQKLIYLILFLIIFVETGLVVMPFLPGDSLLFAAGMIASQAPEAFEAEHHCTNVLEIGILIPLFMAAAFLGDNTNYFIGNRIGVRIFNLKIPFLKREYLTRTEEFFRKHGGKTIIIARYIPIVRTFTPFVAGMGSMVYRKFILFSVFGAALWVVLFTFLGYFMGNIPWVKSNLKMVVLIIIASSVLPLVVQFLKERFKRPAA